MAINSPEQRKQQHEVAADAREDGDFDGGGALEASRVGEDVKGAKEVLRLYL